MRRFLPILIVGAAASFAVACRDTLLEPAHAPMVGAASLSRSGRENAGVSRTVISSFVISPDGGTYRVGDFDLVIPAGAVCDPATSGYGRRAWNQDCATISAPITVNVVAESRGDRVKVDFQPDLRFRPGASWVTLQTSAFKDYLTSDAARSLAATDPSFGRFVMLYAPSHGAAVDEAYGLRDRSLVTHVDRNAGIVWRRVQHFSGYLIASGAKCEPTADGTCTTDSALTSTSSASTGFTVFDSTTVTTSLVVSP